MNILIAAIFSIDSYSRGIMPDVLQTQIENNPGANIYYLTNSNSFDVCYFNFDKRPETCYRCKAGVKNTLSLIEGSFKHLTIREIINSDDIKQAELFFRNKDTVTFGDVFENFEVGAATLSTYISRTRDQDLIHLQEYPHLKELAVNALSLYLGLKRFLTQREIDVVYNFNGRQEYVRAVMSAAMKVDIDCYNVERTRLKGYIDFYKNTLPHDIKYKFHLVEKYWDESNFSDEEKERVGSNFYQRQRSGESVVFPSYTGSMKKGQLPDFIQNGNKNIVVFTSSDDEIAAFGKIFQNPYFRNQNEGLVFLVDLVGKKMLSHNLLIRMHPNLAGVEKNYVTEVRDLHQKYSNIFVIDPESATDSYSLMDVAEKVISFGSTTGLEANFLRKPVILLGIGFYYHADFAHKPANREQIELLLKSHLEPRPLMDTLKVGFYFEQGGIKTNYYFESKMGEGIFFKKKRVHFYSPQQRLKAKLIEAAYKYANVRLRLKN